MPKNVWKKYKVGITDKYSFTDIIGIQCDQIWPKNLSLGQFFEGLFNIGQNCEPTLATFKCYWARAKYCKNDLAIWSHLSAKQTPVLEWFN